jgi:hypothetical protein
MVFKLWILVFWIVSSTLKMKVILSSMHHGKERNLYLFKGLLYHVATL